jgi:2-polyprenyl-6-methoxyphenol hydroxylase-like FAD-dependent oxidoreductase
MARPRALVIGGSLGGLFAANLLRTIGWDAAVFERARGDLAGRGTGLGTRDELFAVMRRIGIRNDGSIGIEVRSRVCLGAGGDVICEIPVRQVSTAWDRIYHALRNALPSELYNSGMQLERFEPDARKITAVFTDGTRAEGDLLIGADGIYSTVRQQLMPDLKPSYAGYVAWRGVAEEDDVPEEFRPTVFDHMNFCFPDGELALTVPMTPLLNATRASARRCQFSWFRPVGDGEKLAELCTDANGRRHGVSIPPPLIRPELLAALRVRSKAILAPQIAVLIERAEQPIMQPIFDLESPQLVFGRALLLGDAAFVARPHVGTGVTKAALDAQCLVDALQATGNDIEAALAWYDRDRRQFGRRLVGRGRYLGGYLTAQLKPRDQRTAAELYRRPETVMSEFGGAAMLSSLGAEMGAEPV